MGKTSNLKKGKTKQNKTKTQKTKNALGARGTEWEETCKVLVPEKMIKNSNLTDCAVLHVF